MRMVVDRFFGFDHPHTLLTLQWELPMGLFDAIAGLQKMAEDPELAKSAMALGSAAQAIPTVLTEIRDLLHAQISLHQDEQIERAKWGGLFVEQLTSINNRLVEISLGLDTLADPVKRPPFGVGDVEAAMRGEWPPDPHSSDHIQGAELLVGQKASDLADDLHSMMTRLPGRPGVTDQPDVDFERHLENKAPENGRRT